MLALLAVSLALPAPRLVAIQEWRGLHRVRSWGMDGKPLPTTIRVDRGDDWFPRKTPALELVAAIPCGKDEEFPNGFWRIARGLKGFYNSSSWKNGDIGTQTACFSLVGFAKAKEASVDLFLAKGPSKTAAQTELTPMGRWFTFGRGFRARIRTTPDLNDLREYRFSTRVELKAPPAYRHHELKSALRTADGAIEPSMIEGNEGNGKWEYRFDGPLPKGSELVVKSRRYVRYRFVHVPLRPRR